MATFTTHYNLIKPASGSHPGATPLNANWDTIDSKIYSASIFPAAETASWAINALTASSLEGSIESSSYSLSSSYSDTAQTLLGSIDSSSYSLSSSYSDTAQTVLGNIDSSSYSLSSSFADTAQTVLGNIDSSSYSLSSSFASHFDRVVGIALSDEITPFLTASNSLTTFRIPYDMELTKVKASLTITGSTDMILDVNVNGSSILSTYLTIGSGSLTSKGADIPFVIATDSSSLLDDDEIKIDIKSVGSSSAGLKIYLIGN